jgi:hypothetical protein
VAGLSRKHWRIWERICRSLVTEIISLQPYGPTMKESLSYPNNTLSIALSAETVSPLHEQDIPVRAWKS